MSTSRYISRFVLAAILVMTSFVPPAAAQSVPANHELVQASGDCYAIGMQYAAQAGGQLARATPEIRSGQRVCVIVILMPARDGQRPRRDEIVVPAG